MQRLRITAVVVGLTAAALSPLGFEHDSFPLSTFPMFSKARPNTVSIARVMAVGEEGEAPVPPALVASGEVLQAKVAIAQAAASPSEAAKLCSAVAKRLKLRGEPSALRVVQDDLPVPEYLQTHKPDKRAVLAKCGP